MNIEVKINEPFEDYIFNWEKRFYFVVGGYGSGKSDATALKLILKIINEPKRKILVVRNVFATLKESCFDVLLEVITRLGIGSQFKITTTPLSIRHKNGSRFIFRGLDKPEKLKSVHGVSIIWIEESPEISYKGFKELNGRLRTLNQSMHIIMSQNPVSKNSWCYSHFFKDRFIDENDLYKNKTIKTKDTYYHHSVVDNNMFSPRSYMEQLEELKTYDLYLYEVARKGKFGTLGTRVLPQVESMKSEVMLKEIELIESKLERIGMDFGFETSFNSILKMVVDKEKKYLYIQWEFYKNKMTDDETADDPDLQELKESEEKIRADSAEPKAIAYYKKRGFNIVAAKKFKGSRLANTKKIKRFKKIFISTDCPKCYGELKDLSYAEDKNGNIISDKFNIDPHTFSSIWYGLDGYEVTDLKKINYFS